jgi:2-polyprenyl-3-methyl-5-hydroxy-6-metoxy-1,4-benzoquinol methylase
VLSPEGPTLVLGCGQSRLSNEICNNGFANISNIDFSDVVIKTLKANKPADCPMEYRVMDICGVSLIIKLIFCLLL